MTEPARPLRPPGGHPPPTVQRLGDGTELDLRSLAAEICDRYKELEWLAGVLEARDFPLERLARNLEIASEVVSERVGSEEAKGLAAKLRDGAELVRPSATDP